MAETINMDPVTRIEGHLAVSITVEQGAVDQAHCKGEMFRGFETILKGRDPLDAQQITQRICGVCPVSHGIASILAQDRAYGIEPPENGRLIRNLILGANYIQSHIIHFYHLSAVDFIDLTAIAGYNGSDNELLDFKSWLLARKVSTAGYPAAPFLPRYEGRYMEGTDANIDAVKHYLEGFKMRALAQKMATLFAGKRPHVPSLVPGGVTEQVTSDKIAAFGDMLHTLQSFIDRSYLPDVLALAAAFPDYCDIGRGCGNLMAYGAFPESDDHTRLFFPSGILLDGRPADLDIGRISEDVGHSYYKSPSGLAPFDGRTDPDPGKQEAYSWLKAPRYEGMVMEVGPVARILTAFHRDMDPTKKLVDMLCRKLDRTPEALLSVMGRHAARAIECKLVADRCAEWLDQLKPDAPTFTDFAIPARATGIGLTEAPRGALGHWMAIDGHKIQRYQCVVPTTWNCSPRDDKGIPGPVEQALVGVPVADTAHPIEAMRVVRSFDPCIACAVH